MAKKVTDQKLYPFDTYTCMSTGAHKKIITLNKGMITLNNAA